MKLMLACLVLLLPVFGPVSSALAAEAKYRCADGTAVRALFRSGVPMGSVQLRFAGRGRTVSLPQVLSADGGRYADGTMEFWIKDGASDARGRRNRVQNEALKRRLRPLKCRGGRSRQYHPDLGELTRQRFDFN